MSPRKWRKSRSNGHDVVEYDLQFLIHNMTSFERRRSARAALQARASLSCGSAFLGVYDVINLALGGVLLAGPAPVAIGTDVEITLALAEPAAVAPALVISGRLLRERTTCDGPGFVVVLEELAPAQAMRIGTAVERSLIEARNAHVLVVDQTRTSRWQLRTQLVGMGHATHAVATPLEAVNALGEANRFEVAMVALDADALDLMAHLADQHPYLRRIILSDRRHGHLGPALRHRPQAAPHEVLARPCNEAALARAVGG
jgi:CheY-like chemotaxis protein